MQIDTISRHENILAKCKSLFLKKNEDYGSSWRILRPTSITDQIMIKAQRIRSLEEKEFQLVSDDIPSEFVGIINYSIIGLIQLELQDNDSLDIPSNTIIELFQKFSKESNDLLKLKNHDYEEAWKDMRTSSLTDIILMKLLRIKQIEDNKGKTLVSEGIASNYHDIINYSVFALLKLGYCEEPN